MLRRFFVIGAIGLTALGAATPVATAEEAKKDASEDAANFQYQTVTTKEGLHFRVPEDMPIEQKGGIQAPVPFDEYMYGKFKQIDARLKGIETKLENIEKILSSMLEDRRKVLKG